MGSFYRFHSSSLSTSENYLLANPEWKHDIVPEILDGKNVADFVDPDILEKLEALEREEEKLEAEGFYASDSDMVRISTSSFRRGLTTPFRLIRMMNGRPLSSRMDWRRS